MLGLYDRTPLRAKVALDGWWDFVIDSDDVGVTEEYYLRYPEEESTRIVVPGVWETEFGLEDYQGVAWYHKRFEAPFPGPCLVVFGAVAYIARVWLNGEFLGEHEGDFGAFHLPGHLEEGENQLVVRVDNRHTDESLPKEVVDWYPYGGITRSVVVEQLDNAYIERIHIVGHLDGRVDVQAHVRSISEGALELPLTLAIEGAEEVERTVALAPGVRVIETLRTTISEPALWSPMDPNLYWVQVRLGDDLYVERFGLREIRTDGHRLLLNGEPIWLRGVNRHEDHPDWGFALPDKIMQRDVDIIESLNCNAVRGSHYPNHPTFLDLCDEEGLLFFSEVPGWQYNAYQLSHSPTRDKLAQQLEEMIVQHYNHPSIIVWSLHNECDTEISREGDLDVRSTMEDLFRLARSLDDTRLVTYVSHRHWRDQHLDLADIVCLNEYIGWYREEQDGAGFAEYLERMVELVPDKPILITEFGAGGLYGYHSMPQRRWSEEYQAAHILRQIIQMRENEHVAGCYVWQYCDILSNPSRAMMRPRSMNNKGLVDEYRRPKMAYYAVRDVFADIADEEE